MNNLPQTNQSELQQPQDSHSMPVQAETATNPAPKKSNKLILLLIGALVIILIIAGAVATPILKYIASNEDSIQQSTNTDTTDKTQVTDEYESQGAQETKTPADDNNHATNSSDTNQDSQLSREELVFYEELGLSLKVPSDWEIKEMLDVFNEKNVELIKGEYSLRIIKDPIYTGGGVGWEYDGLSFEEIRIIKEADLTIGNKPFYRFTQYLTSLPEELKERSIASDSLNLENIFANSLISSDSTGMETPALRITVNGEEREYMIKYQYNTIDDLSSQDPVYSYVSLDNPEHQQIMKEMDQIMESISFK